MPTNSDFSSDSAFRDGVNSALDTLVDQIDALDLDAVDDLDLRLTPGNLHVTFEDTGAVFVLSQQTPTHELWLSANLTAWHFVCTGGQWVERDTREPMVSVLSVLFADKLNGPVSLSL
jgi:iron donor protein CyaY